MASPIILYVVNNAKFLISHRLNLLIGARKQGYQVHVACPLVDAVKIIKDHGCVHHPWQVSRSGTNPFTEILAIRSLYKIYKKLKPDLVHHVTIKPVIYGGVAARLAKVPATINAVSGLGSTYISDSLKVKLIRKIANSGYAISGRHPNSKFIFQNKDDQRLFVKSGVAKQKQSQIILGSGVCMKQYQPLAMPLDEKITVVLASRMLIDKGILEFVEAARLLATKEKLRLVLVGDVDPGNPASLQKKQIQAWADEGIIEWWGFRDDMQNVFAASHIVCLPSYREGSPRVLIEAAASARPIITTDTSGCRDLVKHNVNGLLVPIKDARSLANAIDQLASMPQSLQEMGMQSRKLVEHNYAEEIVLSQTFDTYKSLSLIA